MSSLRDKVFYCDTDKKKKAVVKILLDRGESVGPATKRGVASEFKFVYYEPAMSAWNGHNHNRLGGEIIEL